MKKSILLFGTAIISTTLFAQSGNVGIGTNTPGTKLDVNGAITNRETSVAVAGNAATIPANISQVRLTGAATAAVAITAPAAPNAGQRLIIYNNTTGGFSATLNGIAIPNGKALEFAYSNSNWQSTNGGAIAGDYDWMRAGNTFPNSPGDTAQFVYHMGAVGIGTNTPLGKLHVDGGDVDITSGISQWELNPALGGSTGSASSFEIIDRSSSVRRMVFNNNGNVYLGGSIINTAGAGAAMGVVGSNIGIGTLAPTNKLHVVAAADPLKLTGLQSAEGTALVVDASGVVKKRSASVETPRLALVVKRGTDYTGGAGDIPWDSEVYDSENAFTPGSSIYFVQKNGLHQIFVNTTVYSTTSASITAWYVRIKKNGDVIAASDASSASGSSSTVFAIDNFTIGDEITVDFGIIPDACSAELTKLSIFRFE